VPPTSSSAASSRPTLPRRAAIVGANRIPFARSNGAYARASNQDMLTSALDGLVALFGLAGERLGEVVAGAVLKHSRDFNLTRESVLGSRLSAATPTYDVQQACGTSLQTAVLVANKIALGQIESGVAAGVDTTSDAPIEVNDELRRVLLAANRAKSTAGVLKALAGLRPGQIVPEIPANREPRTGMAMGEHAAQTAAAWGISRTAQDEITVASHQNLAAAYERGFFDDLMTPYLGLTRDNNLRADSTLEGLAKLKPVFKPAGYPDTEATMTAANSTPLTDGAATVLLASDEWAAERNLPVLAHVVDAETAAVDYVHGDEGLLMAPTYAVPRMLERNGLTLQDFDFYEFHEAFASTILATFAAWEDPIFCKERLGLDEPLGSFDRAKLNVAGSSLATGHPFAATGARIVPTLAKLLHEKGSGRGLISICAAGGQGVVAILEA
jgi:acetyl-CoA C-acetyltransferase